MARPITPELVLTGYLRGAFPMCEPESGRVEWFTCDPRALVPLDERFRVAQSLSRGPLFKLIEEADAAGGVPSSATGD